MTALEFELWGVEYHQSGKRSMVRVYIESSNGITVDDCAQVSHQVSGVLDVEDPISGEYTLEVSSPGVDRPLFRIEHYTQNIGQTVNLRLFAPFEGRRKFKGVITGVENDEVMMVVDGYEYAFPIEGIEKAQVVGFVDETNE